ncbi:MAG: DUF3574 domain-containing protein [Leptospirales bacterium]
MTTRFNINKVILKKVLLTLFIVGLTGFSYNTIILGKTSQTTWVKVQLYFGLSKPGGAVSIQEWQAFQKEVIDAEFEGYNLLDSLGYWKGKPERSKVLTIILQEKSVSKAKTVAKKYSIRFDQQSVMLVKTRINEVAFIGK